MSKAEETYQRVQALVDGGMKKADAFKQIAEDNGQPVDSIRGAYYGYLRKQGGGNGTSRPRKRETTAADAVEQATTALRRSIERIDAEIAAAEVRAQEAQAEYEAMVSSADERKKEIEAKIAALES